MPMKYSYGPSLQEHWHRLEEECNHLETGAYFWSKEQEIHREYIHGKTIQKHGHGWEEKSNHLKTPYASTNHCAIQYK